MDNNAKYYAATYEDVVPLYLTMTGISNRELKSYHRLIVKGISELVKLPTVFDAATITEGMPYGKNIYEGYLWLKNKALEDGFEVVEYDGHALAIRIKGNQARTRIDIVSHVDVVEPGSGWRDDPFSGKITPKYLHGRGSQDMKGALMITYYALKFMKDHKIPCKNEVRLVIGCDEERTMEDIRYYISKAGEPTFAFTPDGKFPFSLGEKGALMWHISGRMDTCIKEFNGGVQCNVVSPEARAIIRDDQNYEIYKKLFHKKKLKGEIYKENNTIRIKVYGKAAHASIPQEGVNASVQLLNLICEVGKDPLATLLYSCFYDYHGKGAGIDYDIAPMGKLTVNLGILRVKENMVLADVDCRYPLGISSDILTKQVEKVLEVLTVELAYDDSPTLADQDSPYINALWNAYRHSSKDKSSKPLISGGVTYSKAIGNCVAFGPMTETDNNLAHQANEKINIHNIEPLFKIYTETMIELGNV